MNRENPRHETEKLVSIEESKGLAKQLLTLYESQIRNYLQKDVDGLGKLYTDYQDSTSHFLKMISEDIREHYQGHGITRGSELDRLTALLNIMANQAIKGEHGPLVGGDSAVIRAFQKEIEFLVISKKDKPLHKEQGKNGRMQPIFNEMNQWQADIGTIIVNTKYYPLVSEFRKMFPNVSIIKASELTEYFKEKN